MALNPLISNGTCYYKAGEEADSVFIPCGNDALGHKTCCGAGDKCLSSRACYNARYGLTYLVGCSDPDYRDPNCPDKHNDSPWVGLVTCKGSNNWSACPQSAKPSTLTSPDACSCPRTPATVAFTDATRLTDIASLPTAVGNSIVWEAGFLPTSSTAAPTPTSSSASTSSSVSSLSSSTAPVTTPSSPGSSTRPVEPSTSVPPPAPTPEPQHDTPAPLSSGTKAGIGAGVTIGVLALLACLAAILVSRLRRRRRRRNQEPTTPFPTNPDTTTTEPKYAWTPSTVATPAVSELGTTAAARPWSLRSELAGNDDQSPRSLGAVFEGGGGYTDHGGRDARYAGGWDGQPQGLGVFGARAELQG